MSDYLVKFKPLEPYFFGNEKSLWFGYRRSQKTNSYFIRSNDAPSQMTILGTLRFSLINEQYNVYSNDKDSNKKNFEKIGEESFDIEKDDQSFGNIKKVSPLFLTCKNQKGEYVYFIKTPFDHKINNINKFEHLYYRPFIQYERCETSVETKYIPLDYNPKDGISSSFLNLSTMEICNDFFTSTIRVGIKTNSDEEGFFKKEYKSLRKDLSFAVFANIEGEVRDRVVYLGRDKSAFLLSFEKIEDGFKNNEKEFGISKIEIIARNIINYREYLNKSFFLEDSEVAIALSDIYVDKEIYEFCYFVNSATQEHRTFKTKYEKDLNFRKRYHKNLEVINLLKAGSMFLVKKEKLKDFKEKINNKNCQNIGLNICIFGGI